MPFERSFETGRISVMIGSRRVLVKVVLFQLRGRGHPQDDATSNLFADSKRQATNDSEFLTIGLYLLLM